MKNILFIGCLYSDADKEKFRSQSKRGYQFAAQNFQEALLKGFLENDVRPFVVTVPALSTYPGGYRRPMVKGSEYILLGQDLGKSIGFVNIPFLNTRFCGLDSLAHRWSSAQKGEKYVVVYGAHSHLMEAAVKLKGKEDDVKLCLIVPDLPKYMACNSLYKKLGLKARDLRRIDKMLPKFDAVAVLAAPMIKELGFTNRPHITVEGIYSENNLPDCHRTNKNQKVILYTGGLFMRYGIGDLIDAFMLIDNPDYHLWLCGRGDAVPYIKECAAKNNRIEYKGVVSKEEAAKYQSEATLLVNPRHSKEEFTKYSFPSKTMEYLASGTPTVMCHLECIPPEYDEHLYYFEDESVEGMARKIQEICSMDEDALATKGMNASNFIIREKQAKIQTKKILELLEQIS